MSALRHSYLATGALVGALATFCAGCQHDVLVRSWPSGATVYLDDAPNLDEPTTTSVGSTNAGDDDETNSSDKDEPLSASSEVDIGTTPFRWSEPVGPSKPRQLKLVVGDEVREVVVDRSEYSWPAIAASMGAGAASCVALTGLGFAAWGIAMGASDGTFAPFFPGVTVPIGLLACAGGIGGGFLYGREGPAEIMVDLEGARVISLPRDVARWKGDAPAPLVLDTFETSRPENAGAPIEGDAPPKPAEDDALESSSTANDDGGDDAPPSPNDARTPAANEMGTPSTNEAGDVDGADATGSSDAESEDATDKLSDEPVRH